MSPEAILGGTTNILGGPPMKVGRPSDIWSLGCILYQMVYGRTPFAELAFVQKMHAICEPRYAIAYPPVSNPDVVHLIQRCLDRDPKTRADMEVRGGGEDKAGGGRGVTRHRGKLGGVRAWRWGCRVDSAALSKLPGLYNQSVLVVVGLRAWECCVWFLEIEELSVDPDNEAKVGIFRRPVLMQQPPVVPPPAQELLEHPFLHPNRSRAAAAPPPGAAAGALPLSEGQLRQLVAQVAQAGASGVTDIDKLTRQLMSQLATSGAAGAAGGQ
jgi:hypothetical protein